MFLIGQVLGHCRITAKIGEGGMGVVYRAYDEALHRDVAVKVVKKETGAGASASQNLLQEARASSALAHPNICTIHEVGETDGDVLSALWNLYPGVRDRVVNEQGQIRQHINIFIGNENIRYSGGLTSPVSEGAEISIVPAVSGG